MTESSGSLETLLPKLEEGVWNKADNLEEMIENLDVFKTSKDSTDQQNPVVLSSFESDFDCRNQFAQDGYSMEDIFPTAFLGSSFDDSSQPVESWPTSLTPSYPSATSSANSDDNPENLSRVFMEFLHTNRDWFSVADLRNIRLKTSTIESATQRLGGGKRGMAYLLKLILMWVQHHHLPRKRQRNDGCFGMDDKLLNNILCIPSSIEDQMKAEMDLYGSFDKEGKSQGNNVALVNTVTPQRGVDPNLSSETSVRVYSSLVSSQSSNVGPFGQMASHSTGLNIREPQLCSSTADPNIHIYHQHNHVSPTCTFSIYNQQLSNDRSMHAEISTREATLRDSRDPFASRMPLDNCNVTLSTPAAKTRAARRSRMARQRWSIRHSHFRPAAGINQFSWTSQSESSFQNTSLPAQGFSMPLTVFADSKQSKKPENLRILLRKELKQSDVGSLGRIVLPKKEAELNLPYLAIRDGISVVVEDWSSSTVWSMRYRFWPNNKSRMYVLENTGDFVRFHHLGKGDHMILYGDVAIGRYVIQGIKTAGKDMSTSTVTCKSSSSSCYSSGSTDGAHSEIYESSESIWTIQSKGDGQ